MQQCVTDMMALDLKESVLLYAHKSSLNTEVAIKFTCVQHFQKVHCIVQAQLSYHTHCEGGREDAARPEPVDDREAMFIDWSDPASCSSHQHRRHVDWE